MFEARPAGQRLAVLTSALILAACASRGPAPSRPATPGTSSPKVTQWPSRDGPESVVPADLDKIPDALPRPESIRKGGPNKPYAVAGQRYEPLTDDDQLVQRGLASWYGRKFHGKPTSSGEVYNMYAMTAAHPTMPIPSYARVRNPKNGREVIVRINDRGPFHGGRIIDLSYTAALKLDLLRGVSEVEVERITYEDIRTGAWLRGKDMPSPADVPDTPVYAAATPSGAPEVTTTGQLRNAPTATAAQTSRPTPRPVAPTAQATQLASVAQNTPAQVAQPAAASGNVGAGEAGYAASGANNGTNNGTNSVASSGANSGMVPIPVVALPPGTDLDSPKDLPTASPTLAPDAKLPRMQVAAAAGFWLQLGAFSRLEGAETLREQFNRSLDWMAPMLTIFKDKQLHRLQAGPFNSREDARAAAEKVRTAMALTPVLVERR
ncbi:rare lipoprotein A [Roseateles sp. YR242]|uniref:septal ring lytic transglycosylase RlpA family protein n=1 Tax=Roseateles sp. YR242 TaxID=1855305 RepID=UPI0008C28FB8|nr:septal ring lytic transglycosylase RlpA family protein [Roseateles sp. YR242]SEK83055.1 rare lipoprotein A [Roseateles sp. YR242]